MSPVVNNDETLPTVPRQMANALSLSKLIRSKHHDFMVEQKFVRESNVPPETPDISDNMNMGTSAY